jgi:hypothetical protein
VNALVLEKRALAWGGWGGAAFDRGSARLALAEDDGTRWIVADAFHVDETAAPAGGAVQRIPRAAKRLPAGRRASQPKAHICRSTTFSKNRWGEAAGRH